MHHPSRSIDFFPFSIISSDIQITLEEFFQELGSHI
jgi:hypothetical protein